MSRPTIVTLFRWKLSFSNFLFRCNEILRVWHSKQTPAFGNVRLIDLNASLLRHCVKLCAEMMRRVRCCPFDQSGL
jgi:hypothetical protein